MTTNAPHPHDDLHEGDEPPPPGVHAAAIVRWVIIGGAVGIALFSLLFITGAMGAVGRMVGLGGGSMSGSMAAGADVYQCPMHPAIVKDRPGDCPICSMSLVKVEKRIETAQDSMTAGSTTAGSMTAGTSQVPGLATVDLSAEKLQRSGVTTVAAARRAVSDPVRTVATVTADESKLAKVQTRFSGWVETLQVAETGQKVKKGEVLASIFSRELFTAQQEFLNAAGWARGGADEVAGGLKGQARQRLELLGIAPADITAIERSGKPMRALPVRAPISGYVTFKGATEGVFVDPGTELFEIADLSLVWAWADVYERDLARVASGQRAVLTVAALPGKTFEGKVTFLQPVVDPKSRTLRARVEIENKTLLLRPGMYGDVEIFPPPREGIVIPREALVDTGERQYVFTRVGEGRFQPRRVTVGGSAGEEIVVLEGLAPGDEVVTNGNFLVDSESRLRAVADSSMKTAGGAEARTDVPIDAAKFPDKHRAWLECERVHRGMGTMEEDCRKTIPKPWM